jgi:protoporphyrinogen oxidase
MSALPEALAAELDVRLHSPASMVRSLGESRGVVLRTPEGAEQFDAVVLATTATAARQILASPTDAQRRLLNAVRYSSTISTCFRVDPDRLPEATLFWVPFRESARIASFANEGMKGGDVVKGNRSLLSVWLHEEFASKVMARPDEWIFAAVSKALGEVCPWMPTADLSPHDLQRWPQAEPKFYEGYLRLVRTFQEDHQGAGGIYLSGDYLNAPWTEGAARKGRDVAHRILEHRNDAGARRRP